MHFVILPRTPLTHPSRAPPLHLPPPMPLPDTLPLPCPSPHRHSLDEMEGWVRAKFGPVLGKGLTPIQVPGVCVWGGGGHGEAGKTACLACSQEMWSYHGVRGGPSIVFPFILIPFIPAFIPVACSGFLLRYIYWYSLEGKSL